MSAHDTAPPAGDRWGQARYELEAFAAGMDPWEAVTQSIRLAIRRADALDAAVAALKAALTQLPMAEYTGAAGRAVAVVVRNQVRAALAAAQAAQET